jgi:hypothetical protein
MNRQTSQTRYRWLFTAVMVLMLGAQCLQAGHLHADHGFTPDCAQCQADGGQAVGVTDAVTPLCLPAAGAPDPAIAVVTVATFYRLAARGPPALPS